jgi:hypothetical protein
MEATKRPGERQPDDTVRGVWRLRDRPGRPNPYGVQWREKVWSDRLGREVTKRPSEFFASADERDRRYAEIAQNKRLGKPSAMSRAEIRQWEAFLVAAGGVPWQQVLAGYHAHIEATGIKPCADTVATWGKEYLAECAARMARKELSEDAERHKRRAIGELTARLGHLLLDRPTAKEVEQMIDDMGNGHPPTFNGYRKIYFAFFNRAKALKKIRENPIAAMGKRRFHVDNRDRKLTPQQTAQLFAFGLDHPSFQKILGRLALEFFLGVRFSSGYRAEKKDINPHEHLVNLPAAKLKTGLEGGTGHQIDTSNFPGLEPVWEWIAIAPEEGWAVTPRAYMELKSQLFTAAGVPHPKNCARKSFATYDLAAHRNPGRTAYILGHTNQEELWEDYKGNATQAEGRLYQMITPGTCREIGASGRPPAPSRRRKAPARRGGS